MACLDYLLRAHHDSIEGQVAVGKEVSWDGKEHRARTPRRSSQEPQRVQGWKDLVQEGHLDRSHPQWQPQAAQGRPQRKVTTCWRRFGAASRWCGCQPIPPCHLSLVVGEKPAPRPPCPGSDLSGRELAGLVIDVDASIVVAYSEKEQATPTLKGTFGYHPLMAFCVQCAALHVEVHVAVDVLVISMALWPDHPYSNTPSGAV